MKYLLVFLLAGATYLALARHAPVTQGVHAITEEPKAAAAQAGTPGSNFLKRPIDRTEEVLKQARSRADDPALQ
jgi:hypothetical protein